MGELGFSRGSVQNEPGSKSAEKSAISDKSEEILDEEWRPVLGFESLYEVSNLGRIINLRTKRLLTQSETPKGYLAVNLRSADKSIGRRVHTLVLNAFVGPMPPEAHGCRHLDGKKKNNVLSNLRWGTREENEADKLRHGTAVYGERSPHAVLRESDVITIREMYQAGYRIFEINKKFPMVDWTQIRKIVRNRSWKYLLNRRTDA